MYLDLSVTSYEFEGVDGEVHTFAGCSVEGGIEFGQRLTELNTLLLDLAEADLGWLYRNHARFRWLVNRLLRLNGVAPAWCSWSQVEALLLFREAESPGEWLPGWLVEINTLEESGTGGKAVGLMEFVAAIAPLVGGVDQARELSQTLPRPDLLALVRHLADQAQTPEQREQKGFDDWKDRKRAEMAARAQTKTDTMSDLEVSVNG